MYKMKKSVDLVTTLENDVGLKFGQNKSCYMVVKMEGSINQSSNYFINDLAVSSLSDEKRCTYLGVGKKQMHHI